LLCDFLSSNDGAANMKDMAIFDKRCRVADFDDVSMPFARPLRAARL
jgi:hypothetical protein